MDSETVLNVAIARGLGYTVEFDGDEPWLNDDDGEAWVPEFASNGADMVWLVEKLRGIFGVVEMGATRDNISINVPRWFAFVGRQKARADTLPMAVALAAEKALTAVSPPSMHSDPAQEVSDGV